MGLRGFSRVSSASSSELQQTVQIMYIFQVLGQSTIIFFCIQGAFGTTLGKELPRDVYTIKYTLQFTGYGIWYTHQLHGETKGSKGNRLSIIVGVRLGTYNPQPSVGGSLFGGIRVILMLISLWKSKLNFKLSFLRFGFC